MCTVFLKSLPIPKMDIIKWTQESQQQYSETPISKVIPHDFQPFQNTNSLVQWSHRNVDCNVSTMISFAAALIQLNIYLTFVNLGLDESTLINLDFGLALDYSRFRYIHSLKWIVIIEHTGYQRICVESLIISRHCL